MRSGALLASLLCAPAFAAAEIRVVTTTTTLRSITERIAAGRVRVESVAKGPQDPHFVEAKPSYTVRLREADLLVAIGLDLEIGWLPNVIRGARNPKVAPGGPGHLEAGALVRAIEIPAGKVDRSQGDVHPLGNPHFVLDPVRAAEAARGISARLAALDPAGAGE